MKLDETRALRNIGSSASIITARSLEARLAIVRKRRFGRIKPFSKAPPVTSDFYVDCPSSQVYCESTIKVLVSLWYVGVFPSGADGCGSEMMMLLPRMAKRFSRDTMVLLNKDHTRPAYRSVVPDLWKIGRWPCTFACKPVSSSGHEQCLATDLW